MEFGIFYSRIMNLKISQKFSKILENKVTDNELCYKGHTITNYKGTYHCKNCLGPDVSPG